MEKLNPQVRDVYAEHGCVMGEAQLVERYLAYMIIGAQGQLTSKDYNHELAGLLRKPLGDLIRRFKKSLPVPRTFEA